MRLCLHPQTLTAKRPPPEAYPADTDATKNLKGVHSGRLNKQIAYDLGIAGATVKAHMTALMRKLNVRNRTPVAVAVQSLGLPAGS